MIFVLEVHLRDNFLKQNYQYPIDLRLTSNPSRTEANALYQALGFVRRETNVYEMKL